MKIININFKIILFKQITTKYSNKILKIKSKNNNNFMTINKELLFNNKINPKFHLESKKIFKNLRMKINL